MKVAHLTNGPDAIHGIEGVNTKTFSVGRPENNKKPNPISPMHQTYNESAIYYKPAES